MVERFLMENFDSNEDSLKMVILYFIHTFLLSQLKDAPAPLENFKIVEDGKYKAFPWGKLAFSKLMSSLRQEYFIQNQLYHLEGMPHVINVWMFESCSEVEKSIVIRTDNEIPRILNWKIETFKTQYNKFMVGKFSKVY